MLTGSKHQEIHSKLWGKEKKQTNQKTVKHVARNICFSPIPFIYNDVNLSLIWLIIFILQDPGIIFRRTASFVFFVLFCFLSAFACNILERLLLDDFCECNKPIRVSVDDAVWRTGKQKICYPVFFCNQ